MHNSIYYRADPSLESKTEEFRKIVHSIIDYHYSGKVDDFLRDTLTSMALKYMEDLGISFLVEDSKRLPVPEVSWGFEDALSCLIRALKVRGDKPKKVYAIPLSMREIRYVNGIIASLEIPPGIKVKPGTFVRTFLDMLSDSLTDKQKIAVILFAISVVEPPWGPLTIKYLKLSILKERSLSC